MALITCPECGGQVSDKAETCPHCGYPLKGHPVSNEPKGYELVLNRVGKRFDCIQVLEFYLNATNDEASKMYDNVLAGGQVLMRCSSKKREHMGKFRDALINAGCDVSINEITEEKALQIKDSTVIHCPRCGSTEITTGQREYGILIGPFGSGKTVNRCSKCGYQWTPTDYGV